MAIMYKDLSTYNKIIRILKKQYGGLEFEDEEYDFDFTDYYLIEFGDDLKKRFVLFKDKIDTEEIAQIKLDTIEIEDGLRKEGNRIINIDPGYITETEVIVPSTKLLPHRTPLKKGIVADKQLEFQDGKVITFRYTFADYRANTDFFLKAIKK